MLMTQRDILFYIFLKIEYIDTYIRYAIDNLLSTNYSLHTNDILIQNQKYKYIGYKIKENIELKVIFDYMNYRKCI